MAILQIYSVLNFLALDMTHPRDIGSFYRIVLLGVYFGFNCSWFKIALQAMDKTYIPHCILEYMKAYMMTSSNGNIFRVTGHLCAEFTAPGDFPTQRPVTRSFDVFFDLSLSKRLSKQWWGWCLETLSHPLWRHRNVIKVWHIFCGICILYCRKHWSI